MTSQGGGGADLLFVALDTNLPAVMEGGDGTDTLRGSLHGDTLQGGAGRDVYQYYSVVDSSPSGGIDLIQDSDGELVVDLSPINTDPKDRWPDRAFTVVDAFDGKHGELIIRYDASDGMTHVEGDVNRDKHADLVILIEGDHTDVKDYVL